MPAVAVAYFVLGIPPFKLVRFHSRLSLQTLFQVVVPAGFVGRLYNITRSSDPVCGLAASTRHGCIWYGQYKTTIIGWARTQSISAQKMDGMHFDPLCLLLSYHCRSGHLLLLKTSATRPPCLAVFVPSLFFYSSLLPTYSPYILFACPFRQEQPRAYCAWRFQNCPCGFPSLGANPTIHISGRPIWINVRKRSPLRAGARKSCGHNQAGHMLDQRAAIVFPESLGTGSGLFVNG